MKIARRTDLITCLAFAGVLIWSAAVAHPAAAASLPHAASCALLAPRLEPSPPRPTPQAAGFQGGAKLRSLVGEPCLPAARAREV
jgi:hypothetical protein